MSEPAETLDDQIAKLIAEANSISTKIVADAKKRDRRSEFQRVADRIWRGLTAILAVSAPALVSYSTTSSVNDLYKLAAIILTGVAGAATTIQVIFGLKEGSIRNALLALSLFELDAKLRSKVDLAEKVGSPSEKFFQLRTAVEEVNSHYDKIIKSDIIAQIDAYKSQLPTS